MSGKKPLKKVHTLFLSEGSSKTQQKMLQKNRVEKCLQKNRQKLQNRFSLVEKI
jgi:hypothetical protein